MKLVKKKVFTAPEKEYKDLREVMDYTVPFELIYSGVENESYYDILYDMGIRSFLMSYHYIQNKHINMANRFKGQKVRLFIDSGAHTYQNDPKYSELGIDFWEEHLKKYLRWVEKNRDYIFAIASFDFENLVGGEQVDKWNKEFFEPFMLRTGIPVCFVWHQNSYNSWDYYCKRYPYVGFSSVNTEGVAIDLNEYRDRLRIAENNDSLVHGFGMTRTSMLTELPFYTSDSTTWLVGLQYGEINFWKETKMTRLKKDAWKGRFLDNICEKYGLDRNKMLDEDIEEIIKANVGAFIDAENFIRTRLKGNMYWMKAKSKKNDITDSSLYPTSEEIRDSSFPIVKYAQGMNINPEAEDSENLVYIGAVLLNWENEDYKEYRTLLLEDENSIQTIDYYHDRFINRIVSCYEEKIQDLISFFTDCVSGENDTLLQLGTNFDREVKERDSYIEDDVEYDTVDISPEEVKVRLAQCLPSPMDVDSDIEKMDEEIYRQAEIVPTWGPDGKLLKGQTKVRKPKQVYSSKYPKFACDTCYAAQRCKEYKAGHVCAFQKRLNRFDTRNQSDIIASIQGIVNHNMARMQRAMIMETMNGVIDPVVSQLMDTNVRYMDMLNRLYENSSAEVLRQSRVIRSDGTVEEHTQISNPQSGGIMEKLFSSLANAPKGQEEEEDIVSVQGEKNERYLNLEED